MISSSKSRTSVPSRVTCNRKLETFFAYIWLACTGTVLGRLTGPRIRTPCRRTSVPASASSQFPPVSTARSTITEPGFMPRTASAVIRIGALPGNGRGSDHDVGVLHLLSEEGELAAMGFLGQLPRIATGRLGLLA